MHVPNALKETDDHARLYLEKTQDCVCSLTLKGEYLTMNPAGCTLHGIDEFEDIAGKSLFDTSSQNRAEVESAISHHHFFQTKNIFYIPDMAYKL